MAAGTTTGGPVIVPRGRDEPQWQGAPSGSWALRNLTQQKEHAAGGQVQQKLWRYDTDTDHRAYNWPPQASNILINLIQQKEFGAGGEVKQKLWRWDTDTDHRAYNWPPQASNVLINFIQQKEFGQGGQVPAKLWRWDYVPDPVWQGAPAANSALLNITPFEKFWRYDYDSGATTWQGAPLANPALLQITPFSKLWRWDLDTSTSWTWSASPVSQQTVLAPSGSPFSKLWRYDLDSDVRSWGWTPPNVTASLPTPPTLLGAWLLQTDVPPDAIGWQWAPVNLEALLAPSASPFSKLWRYDLDTNPSSWQWNPEPNNSNFNLLGGQVPTKFWRYDTDTDHRAYNWPPQASDVLINLIQQKEFGQNGQVPTKLWRWDHDSGQYPWQWSVEPNNSNYLLLKSGNPFSNFWWNNYDSDVRSRALTIAAQQGEPGPAPSVPSLIIQNFSFYVYKDPDPPWIWQPPSAISVLTQFTETYAISADWQWFIGGDQASAWWQWSAEPNNSNFPLLTSPQRPFSYFWRYDYDSGASAWTWTASGSNALNMLVEGGTPFHKLWRYDLDGDIRQWNWQGPSVLQATLALGIAPFRKLWRYDYSPDPFWPGYPIVSGPLNLTSTEQKFFGAPGQVPTKFWRYDLDTDARQWTWGGTNLFIPNVPTGAPFSKFWRYDLDGASWWTGVPTANQSLLDITPFHKLWRYDYDSAAAVWQGAPVPNQSVLDITPFAKFWRYDLDTDTRWLGTPSAAPFNILGGKVPTKLWRWDHVPDPTYQWLPAISLSIRTVPPPTFLVPNMYRLWGNQGDLVPPTYWQGSPMPALVARYYGPLVLQPEMWAIGLARKMTGTGAPRVMTATGLLRRMFAAGVARVLFATGAIRNLFVPGSKRSNE